MKRKKAVRLLAAVLMIVLTWSFVVHGETGIQPLWDYLITIGGDIDIDSSGLASISVDCSGDYRDITKITAKCELQKLDGSWTTIKTWTETEEGCAILYSKSYYVAKNYSYRIKVTAYAYNGSTLLESASVNFNYGYYH